MDFLKPHKGKLRLWNKHVPPKWASDRVPCLGFYISGIFVDHPEFGGKMGYTSMVVDQKGDEIETLNSRYTLEGPEYTNEHKNSPQPL